MAIDPVQNRPEDTPGAAQEFVDVIHVALNSPASLLPAYRACLSADEQQRADRFVTEELTRRSLVCRAVLRTLLGSALEIAPVEIRLNVGPHGKPRLDAADQAFVQFNVSHSEDVALIAVTRRRAVGIDVEAIGRRVSRDELAGRFFSPEERAVYFSLPEERRPAAFYRIWTCKEAYLKATGWGLSFPLGHFSVSSDPDRPPGLLHVVDRPEDPSRWSFVMLPMGTEFAAALAVEGHDWTLRRYTWDHGAGVAVRCDLA